MNSHNVTYGYSLFSSLEGLYLQCKAKFGRTGNSTETCKRILPFSYRCTYINTLKRSYDLLSINWVINACLTNLYTNILNLQISTSLVLCILLKKQVKSSVVQFNIVNTPVTHFTINKNNKYSAISDVLHVCWLSGK